MFRTLTSMKTVVTKRPLIQTMFNTLDARASQELAKQFPETALDDAERDNIEVLRDEHAYEKADCRKDLQTSMYSTHKKPTHKSMREATPSTAFYGRKSRSPLSRSAYEPLDLEQPNENIQKRYFTVLPNDTNSSDTDPIGSAIRSSIISTDSHMNNSKLHENQGLKEEDGIPKADDTTEDLVGNSPIHAAPQTSSLDDAREMAKKDETRNFSSDDLSAFVAEVLEEDPGYYPDVEFTALHVVVPKYTHMERKNLHLDN